MPKHDLVESPRGKKWTGPDAYLRSLARHRAARKARRPMPRTTPETPRLLLSTLPFLALIAGLALLASAIMIAAWPGSHPVAKPRPAAAEKGVAPRGWLEDAEREFHS